MARFQFKKVEGLRRYEVRRNGWFIGEVFRNKAGHWGCTRTSISEITREDAAEMLLYYYSRDGGFTIAGALAA